MKIPAARINFNNRPSNNYAGAPEEDLSQSKSSLQKQESKTYIDGGNSQMSYEQNNRMSKYGGGFL